MHGLVEQLESSAADRTDDATDKGAMLPVPSAASRIARFDLSESRTASPVKPPRHGSAGVGMGAVGGGGRGLSAAAPELELTQVRILDSGHGVRAVYIYTLTHYAPPLTREWSNWVLE